MILAILTTAVIVWALGFSLRSERKWGIISRHGYNNVHSDATAARDEYLG
jgi:hypothetical protein